MKLLSISPKDLVPGAAFCWQPLYDVLRTVVKVESGKLTYRIEHVPGLFYHNIESITPVYLVCPSERSYSLLKKALQRRGYAAAFARFYGDLAARAQRRPNRWPSAAATNLEQLQSWYIESFYTYEMCVQALLAGIYPVTLKPFRVHSWIDATRLLFTAIVTG